MTLPLTLQMEIDLSAAAHKREIAEGFARLRERLIPPLTYEQEQHAMNVRQQQMLWNMAMNNPNPYFNGIGSRNALLSANLAGGSFGGSSWF